MLPLLSTVLLIANSYCMYLNDILPYFSLRDAIQANEWNWENCTMFIQDIVSPGTNIAAEIPADEAFNFRTMCFMFSAWNSHNDLVVDDYISRINSQISQSGSKSGSTLSLNSGKSTPSMSTSLLSLKEAVASLNLQLHPVALVDAVQVEKIAQLIRTEMTDLASRSKNRIHVEKQICDSMRNFLDLIDTSLNCVQFGSAAYGFGGRKTNFDMLVKTGNTNVQVKLE